MLETEGSGPILRLKALVMKFMVRMLSGAFALELTHHRPDIASTH